MVQLYHEFIRSIRTGRLELYIFCLERSSDCFFTFNHPSYARWLVRYHDNLLKLKNTSPDTRRIFERLFLAKKNNKIFLRITNRPERSASNKYWCCLPKLFLLWQIQYLQGKDWLKVISCAEASFHNYLKILIWQLKRLFHKTENLAKYIKAWHTLLNLSKWLN